MHLSDTSRLLLSTERCNPLIARFRADLRQHGRWTWVFASAGFRQACDSFIRSVIESRVRFQAPYVVNAIREGAGKRWNP
jgi:hypothetical protein